MVLVDDFGSVDDVRAGLSATAAGRAAAIRARETVPTGRGVVAVLIGPEAPLDAAGIHALPDLRIVAATSAGTDHVDVAAATSAGAWVTSAAGYCTAEVAEHAIALILDLLRGVTRLDRAVRAGRWDVREAAPRRVAGAVLGLIGFGRTGRAVARLALGLGLRVLAHDPSPAGSVFTAAGVVRCGTLGELLAEADVVSVHAPLKPGAPPILDAAAIAGLRPGAFVVNVARGGLLDTAALGAALATGRVAGAALDVLPVEPPPPHHPVRGFPATVITPHAAWYSADALVRPYRWAGAAVAAILAGTEPDPACGRVVGRPERLVGR